MYRKKKATSPDDMSLWDVPRVFTLSENIIFFALYRIRAEPVTNGTSIAG